MRIGRVGVRRRWRAPGERIGRGRFRRPRDGASCRSRVRWESKRPASTHFRRLFPSRPPYVARRSLRRAQQVGGASQSVPRPKWRRPQLPSLPIIVSPLAPIAIIHHRRDCDRKPQAERYDGFCRSTLNCWRPRCYRIRWKEWVSAERGVSSSAGGENATLAVRTRF